MDRFLVLITLGLALHFATACAVPVTPEQVAKAEQLCLDHEGLLAVDVEPNGRINARCMDGTRLTLWEPAR